jgi:hypoxanthine phosphoribosyltransferase/bifunctional protein TilS/HprT
MHKDIESILVTHDEIQSICKKLGEQITIDYQGKKPLLLGLLKGCIPFMSDLAKHINLYLDIDYLSVSSYHGGITSTGDVKIKKDSDTSLKDRDVLIIEDIVDTASTITTMYEVFKHRGAKSIKVVTLLDKPEGRKKPFQPDYIGMTIPNKFVVGYGLDYNELYRNLPYVGILKKEIYQVKE